MLRLRQCGFVVIFMLVFIMAGCQTEDNTTFNESKISVEAVMEKAQKNTEDFSRADYYDEYINEIANIPGFKAYYKTIFAFEELRDGVSSVPLDQVKAMYDELKTTLDYVVISDYPLGYRGHYDGDPSFVHGYEQYQAADPSQNLPNPINTPGYDYDGAEYIVTPLKTVLLDERSFARLDDSIAEGRNLQFSDFTLSAPDEPISVVLGSKYKGLYEIGDMLSLELVSEMMNFQVVGFYKEGVGFSMGVGKGQRFDFDHYIVMAHFIPEYKPVGPAATFQHAFHIAELTSGHIAITEEISEIDDNTYTHYQAMLENIAKKHGLEGLYKVPRLPVGIIW